MFAKIGKDAPLKKKYEELMLAQQKETDKALSDKLVEFGKTSGFAFSQDDLLAARAELMDRANSNAELSEEDLANVAGGNKAKSDAILYSILTIGLGCYKYSSTSERCGKDQ